MILSMNTSTAQFSLALMEESGSVKAEVFITPTLKSFEGFMPALSDLLTRSSTIKEQIEGLIIAAGPGSFTGLRVGLSAAKGLCQGLKIPIIGVSCLEAIACQLPCPSYPVCSIINSKHQEVFVALFQWSQDGKLTRMTEDTCMPIMDLSSFIEEKTLFLGTDFDGLGPEILKISGEKALLAPTSLWTLRAAAVGTAGLDRFRRRDYDNLRDLVPSYLRPPDIRHNPYPLLKDKSKSPGGTSVSAA
jgi:tRNA threonylcarbamoyladenosine biosynthesis protein TsaB